MGHSHRQGGRAVLHDGDHGRAIHELVDDWIAPAAEAGAGAVAERTPS